MASCTFLIRSPGAEGGQAGAAAPRHPGLLPGPPWESGLCWRRHRASLLKGRKRALCWGPGSIVGHVAQLHCPGPLSSGGPASSLSKRFRTHPPCSRTSEGPRCTWMGPTHPPVS
ncbi:unnamed protein product [Rangifer tarandus platyrhynchus]|uniref:Uncharacterized protein n=1 Tax=Rangifer tarandus platyrhynchus TaxID=3082113 RepID=A0AC59ZIM1_RANTA